MTKKRNASRSLLHRCLKLRRPESRRPQNYATIVTDQLESRTLLTSTALAAFGLQTAAPVDDLTTEDAGDFYIVDGVRQDLHRVVDQWVIPARTADDDMLFRRTNVTDLDGEREVYTGEISFPQNPSELAVPVLATPDGKTRLFPTDEIAFQYFGDDLEEVMAAVDGLTAIEPIGKSQNLFAATVAQTDGLDSIRLASQLDALDSIEWAEPNFVSEYQASFTPNDPSYGLQWHLNTDAPDLGVEEAWDISDGQGVVVAVFDVGFDLTHPDLINSYWVNDAEANGTAGVDDDGNGWIDDIHGIDIANTDGDPSPFTVNDNHGTVVAGVVAAEGNNGVGVAGTAFGSQIMAIKIGNSNGQGGFSLSFVALAEAIEYAWREGASIGNHSYGGGGQSQLVTTAFDVAAADGRNGLGMLNFGSSGNDSFPTTLNPVIFPANIASVIAVGASNQADVRADFSNGGPELEFVAPGEDIFTTDRTGAVGYTDMDGQPDYTSIDGTSFSSPMAAGVAALMISAQPSIAAADVRQILQDTAEEVGTVPYVAGRNDSFGNGRIHVGNAVFSSAVPVLTPVAQNAAGPSSVSWSSIPGATRYRISIKNLTTDIYPYDDSTITTNSFSISTPLDMGRYRMWVQAFNADNVESTWSEAVDFDVVPELLSPVNVVSIDQTPTFTWTAVPGAATYRIFVSVPTQANIDVFGITGTSWTSPSTLPDVGLTSYRWWVQPVTAANQYGEWSDGSDFRILRPQIDSAADAGGGNQLITWWEAAGASNYFLQIRDATTNAIIHNQAAASHSETVSLSTGSYRAWAAVVVSGQPPFWGPEFNFSVASLDVNDEEDSDERDWLFAELKMLQSDLDGNQDEVEMIADRNLEQGRFRKVAKLLSVEEKIEQGATKDGPNTSPVDQTAAVSAGSESPNRWSVDLGSETETQPS